MRIHIAFACLALTGLPGNSVAIDSPAEWRAVGQQTRIRMREMDETLRDRDAQRSYENYLAMFADNVVAYGLYDTGGTDLEGLREHYRPVFFELRDGVLLSDDVIVAGRMAAQRYHSMLFLNGEFDGVEASSRPVFLQGQTIFRFDADGRIAERWSNHDHGYRLGQLQGEHGRTEGDRIARILNGPGLSEEEVIARIDTFQAAFNRMEAPSDREREVRNLFSTAARIHGIADGPTDVSRLIARLAELRSAVPDLRMSVRTSMSAWSMGAFRWTALGSQRARYDGREPDMRPVLITGECILRFDGNGHIVEVWFDTAPPSFDHAN